MDKIKKAKILKDIDDLIDQKRQLKKSRDDVMKSGIPEGKKNFVKKDFENIEEITNIIIETLKQKLLEIEKE